VVENRRSGISVRSVAPDITDDPNGLNASDGYPTPQKSVPQALPLAPSPTPQLTPTAPHTLPVSTQPAGPTQPAAQPATQPATNPTPDPLAFTTQPITADPQVPVTQSYTETPPATPSSPIQYNSLGEPIGDSQEAYIEALLGGSGYQLNGELDPNAATREFSPGALLSGGEFAGIDPSNLSAATLAELAQYGLTPGGAGAWQYASASNNRSAANNPASPPPTPPAIPSNPGSQVYGPEYGSAGGYPDDGSSVAAPSGTDDNGLPTPTSASGLASYALNPTTPSNALTNSVITPGPAVDRFAIAKQQMADERASEEPGYQADLRDANRYAFANGRGYSGIENNSLGDIATQHDTALRTADDNFLNNALVGSIQDAYNNIGIAQQQQGFQAGQQQTAFNQQLTLQQLQDSEQGQAFTQQLQAAGFTDQQIQQAWENAYQTQTLSDSENNQSFMQAYDQYLAGTSGDPASYYEWLAGQYAAPAKAA
jgi:hypothetical protein